MSERTTKHWTLAPSTNEAQLEIDINVEIGRALIYPSHGEACWMGIIEISLVWTRVEVARLMTAGLELHHSTCYA
ncbi:unnamed protein product [Prunus armeniaca]